MSLFKQILLLVTLLLLITLIIVLRINFNAAKEFTANQSYLSAKNYVNTLALSLNSNPDDEVFMETSINAMFDGGYFESITMIRPDGTIAYQKKEDIVISGVPPFFVNHVTLEIPPAEAKVMSGWNIAGTLVIKGHPGTSYQKLWDTLKGLCIQFSCLGIVAFFISFVGLRHLLKSLEKITVQAQEISNNEFIYNDKIPRTPELKKVAIAMNTMVSKVQSIFEQHLDNLRRYQECKYNDEITGLYNKAFFMKTLGEILKKEEAGVDKGQVILFSLHGLQEIESSGQPLVVENIFKQVAEIMKQEAWDIPDCVIARFPRREFAAIMPCAAPQKAADFAKAVTQKYLADKEIISKGDMEIYAGLSSFRAGDGIGKILAGADYALARAKSGISGAVSVFETESQKTVLGKLEWKQMIEDAFDHGRFFLTGQPVLHKERQFHQEVYINITGKDGTHLHADLFMPMVTILGLSERLDRYTLEKSAQYIKDNPGVVLAVNITSEFCLKRMSGLWLRKFLDQWKSVSDRLMFEIHENTLINHPEISVDFSGLINGKGFRVGIDSFTMQEQSLNLLKKIKPCYVKIEREYLEVFDDPEKSDMVLNAVITISHSLGIKLVATKIENKEQMQALSAKHIHYFQGHGIASIDFLKGDNE